MSRDGFELRLAEWLEDGPFVAPERGVRAAIAHAQRHPHTRFHRPLSRLRHGWETATPLARTVGIAAALIALLLLGAALGAGSRFLAAVAPACPAGSTPDTPGDPGLARPPVADNVGGNLVWDREAEQMVFLARAATGGLPTDGAIWTFDVCTNAWHLELTSTDMPDRGPVVHDEDSGLTVAIGDVGVWTYDLDDDTWLRQASEPPGWVTDAVYDPGSGLIIGRSTPTGEMWTYDVEADAWQELDQGALVPPKGGSSGFQLVGFDRAAGRAILTTDAGTWQLDQREHRWERAGPPGPVSFFIGGREIAYGETAERILVYGQGTVAAYDASTQDWQVLAGDPAAGWDLGAGYAMAYDPLNDRLVVVGGGRWDDATGWVPTDAVIAFDLGSREWVELLAPSPPD
jgi:hypothetical protein